MFTTAAQADPNGLHDLPIPFPKSQCVPSNLPRPVYEAALRQHETSARLMGSALGSHGPHERARFAPQTFVPREHGLLTEAPTFPSQDYSRKRTNYGMRSRQRLRLGQTSSRLH